MSEIEFSSIVSNSHALELPRFELQSHHTVRHRPGNWVGAWNELLSYSLNNRGPDVSQVGSTWVGSLVGMQSLHAFSPSEIAKIGGQKNILAAAWEANLLPGDNDVYAIPWIADTRLIYYKRKWLEKAGVDEGTAFSSHEALVETIERITAAGATVPIAFPTTDEMLHTIAPWVWGAGGHFRSEDRRHLNLNHPQTIAGVCQFYNLSRLLTPQAHGLRTDQVDSMFIHQQAAISISNHSLAMNIVSYPAADFDTQAVGAAVIPGIPFIGGSSLVLWKYSLQETAAVEFIRHLLSAEAQTRLYQYANELPVRLDLLEKEPFTTHPLLQVVARSLKTGRAFQSGYQWANIERRLQAMFLQLWTDLFANPSLNIKDEVTRRLEETQNRIEKTILSA
jgi:multiple sugar transport system substrate-binding protein